MSEVRASYCKAAIAAAKRHDHREALLSRLEPVRAVVRRASPLGWIDARNFADITAVVFAVLGRHGAEVFWCERLTAALNRPLMRPLAQGGVFLYGNEPASIIRMTPKSYPLVFRGCGRPAVDVENGVATLTLHDLPPVLRTEGLAACYSGHCLAAAEFSGTHAHVHVDLEGLERKGRLTLTTRWS